MKTLLTLVIIFLAGNSFAIRQQEPIKPIKRPVLIDPAKVELGKKLFFDPRLSKSGVISCNSCHNIATGGVDNRPTSIGHNWSVGPINSPTVLNAGFNLAQFWDGRAKDLKEQAKGPIANPKEMASDHELVIDILKSIPAYKQAFSAIYKAEVTIDNVADAIAAFEETLVTPNARFDQWLKGDDSALTSKELAGYHLFKNKGCVACHNGVAVGGNSYQKLGVVKPYADENPGRYAVTKKPEDKQVFKVPTLRNIALTYPYLHDGSLWTMEEVVNMMATYQLGATLKAEETEAIVAFLHTLTGEQPQLVYPVLPASTATTPRPRN